MQAGPAAFDHKGLSSGWHSISFFKTSYPHSFPRKSLPASHFQTCPIFFCDEPGSLYCLSDVTQERFLFQGSLMGWKWGADGRDSLSCGFNRLLKTVPSNEALQYWTSQNGLQAIFLSGQGVRHPRNRRFSNLCRFFQRPVNRQASFCRWGAVHPVCCQKPIEAKSVLPGTCPLKRTT